MATDHYAVLGVDRNASADDVKRAYRRLARQHHPDANPGDAAAETRFKEVANAYEVLSDPDRRARYDRFGDDGLGGNGGGAGGFAAQGFGDLFDAFFGDANPFGSGQRAGGPPRGADLETSLDIELSEVVSGATKEVGVRTAVACTTCEGTGAAPGTDPVTCSTCGGIGQVRQVRRSILGQMVTTGPCTTCGGMGTQVPTPCSTCNGEGREIVTKTYTVDVPAGVGDGTTLRLNGRGAAGVRGGGYGDLYVHIRVHPHTRFVREGDDLVADVHVSVAQAILGVTLPFETFEGPAEIDIPAGTATGDVIVVAGHGVPRLQGRGRGDIRVRIVVDIPDRLPGEQEELIRRLAELRDEPVAPPGSKLLGRIRSVFS